MTKKQSKRQKGFKKLIVLNMIICLIVGAIMFIDSITQIRLIEPEPKYVKEPVYLYNDLSLNSDDNYLLAKIAMAEAEGCDTKTKSLVIMTVLNRVRHDEFPNTVKEVIYQKTGNTYQFTPVSEKRWNNIEPDEDCWLALRNAMLTEHDFSEGTLFFESCENENNWHSNNLHFLYESNGIRFYR